MQQQQPPVTNGAVLSRQITLGGQSFTITFGFKAVAALEDAYDMGIAKIARRFKAKAMRDDEGKLIMGPPLDGEGKPIPNAPHVPQFETDMRVRDIQRILYAGFREHHPAVTEDAVMDLLESELAKAGNLDKALSETLKAWNASGDQSPPEAGAGDPPAGEPVTGGSTSTN